MSAVNTKPSVILVRPQLAENVGMAARAMMNCNLEDMRLVCPREDHLSAKAVSASSGAERILENARVYNSTTEAVADLTYVCATTARHRNQIKTVYTADRAVCVLNEHLLTGACGILFGPERTGLENDDVSLADAVIEIPLNPEHCSLNLSQAVLLVGYEWYKTQINAPKERFVTNSTTPAVKESLFRFLAYLEESVAEFKNYQDPEKRPTLLRNLHNIFTRGQMTEQELNTLYGLIAYWKKGSNQ